MIRSFEGHVPVLGESVYVDSSAQVIGQVQLGARSSVWPAVVIRGDANWVKIGECTNIQDGTVIHGNHDSAAAVGGDPTCLGDNVVVGHRAMLHACSIHDAVLVGMSVTVLDRAVVEPEVMIAAGSLVPPNKRLESGYLYMGTPVKKVRRLREDEIKHIYYTAQYYYELAQRHMASLSD